MGQPLGRPPALAGKELDLHKLYHTVVGLGGYQYVTQEKLWVQVAQGLKLRQATQCAAPPTAPSVGPRRLTVGARPGQVRVPAAPALLQAARAVRGDAARH